MTASAKQPHRGPYWSDEEVAEALGGIRSGGLVLVKGDIGYGLFGTSERAIRAMYRAKGRSFDNPCIFIGSLAVLDEIADLPSDATRRWCEEVSSWTTVAVVARERKASPVLRRMDPWVRDRSVTDGTLAVFLRTGAYIAELVGRAFSEGWVFVGSSANRSGEGNNYSLPDVPPEIVAVADVVVDHGESAYANPQRRATTIVDTTDWTIRRRGVNADRITQSFADLAARHGVEMAPEPTGPGSARGRGGDGA